MVRTIAQETCLDLERLNRERGAELGRLLVSLSSYDQTPVYFEGSLIIATPTNEKLGYGGPLRIRKNIGPGGETIYVISEITPEGNERKATRFHALRISWRLSAQNPDKSDLGSDNYCLHAKVREPTIWGDLEARFYITEDQVTSDPSN